MYSAPEPLGPQHDVADFVCQSEEQTDWLRQHARQSQASGATRVFVVTTSAERTRVVAYYAWRMAQITLAEAPPRLRKGAGRYPQPVALLARLGVDAEHEGQGLGAGLLRDVILRFVAVSDAIGARALLVHCETDAARDFYRHLVPEFESSPTDDLHLVLMAKDIRKTMR